MSDGLNLCISKKMQPIRDLVTKVASTNTTVLLRGESGVGKEVVARALHTASSRASKQFLKVNCAALPGELLESELVGHEKGSFTGAYRQKPGKFEAADGGTLLLDAIGEMPLRLQAKLLHVLQDGEFSRVGGEKIIDTDVRQELLAGLNHGDHMTSVASVTVTSIGDGPVSLEDIARQAARDAERVAMKEVLDRVHWNRAKAARLLQISYKALLYKIVRCGLVTPEEKERDKEAVSEVIASSRRRPG